MAAPAIGVVVDLEARHDHLRAAADRRGAVADGYDVVIEAAGSDERPHPLRGPVSPGRAGLRTQTWWDAGAELTQTACLQEIDAEPAASAAARDRSAGAIKGVPEP